MDKGERQKNAAALMVMQRVLEKYAESHHLKIEEALERFVNTPIYHVLFDFETGLWKEGPDYILALFLEQLGNEDNCKIRQQIYDTIPIGCPNG